MSNERYEQGVADGYCEGYEDGRIAGLKQISITIKEYKELKKESEFLHRLRMAGVDNWPGYEEAQAEYKDED